MSPRAFGAVGSASLPQPGHGPLFRDSPVAVEPEPDAPVAAPDRPKPSRDVTVARLDRCAHALAAPGALAMVSGRERDALLAAVGAWQRMRQARAG